MKNLARFSVVVFSLTFCVSVAAAFASFPSEIRTIYGEDGRLDLYAVSDSATLRLADSTVALFKARKVEITPSTGRAKLSLVSYNDKYRLCPGERFRDQTVGPDCSGALIGPDLVLTAGHCVGTLHDCQNTKFVFGYAITEEGRNPSDVAAMDVYDCKEIIHSEMNREGPDFAIVRVDRKVEGHEPLELNRDKTSPPVGTKLLVTGYPSGLPLKVAEGGAVRSNSRPGFFVANTDTFGGNSGSPVFNEKSGLIEGVLVRGDDDIVPVRKDNCYITYKCEEDGCRGEDVTKISQALKYVPELR